MARFLNNLNFRFMNYSQLYLTRYPTNINMKKLKNIIVLAIINQCFFINAANTIPIGAITKVIIHNGLEIWKTIFGTQTRTQIIKQIKDNNLNLLLLANLLSPFMKYPFAIAPVHITV